MSHKKLLSLLGVIAASGLGAATLAQAQDQTCPDGTSAVGGYCEASSTVDTSKPGTTEVTLGDVTATVETAPDGTTTITVAGQPPVTFQGADGQSVGTVVITVSSSGAISYNLPDPGPKTVTIGGSIVNAPGAATITTGTPDANGVVTNSYVLQGTGNCQAKLDPLAATNFTAASGVACDVTTGSGRRAAGRAFGADIMHLGNRRDVVRSGPGPDRIWANGGNDVVHGQSNTDTIYGGAGNDSLFGDGSADRIYGGAGNDQISGGDGRDYVDAGAGNDVVRNTARGLDTIKCGSGRDVVYAGPLDKVARDCEVVHRPSR